MSARKNDVHCSGCPLEGVGTPVLAKISSRAKYTIVTDTPTKFNAENGRLISASAAKLLGKELWEAGFGREDFSFVPCIRCPHEEQTYTTKEKKLIRDTCRAYLLDHVAEGKPEAVLPLGAEPARQVTGRAVKITKVRGIVEYSGELHSRVFPLLNPGMVRMYPQHAPTFVSDIRTFRSLTDNSFNLKAVSRGKLGDYEIVDDLQFLIDAKPRVVFFDIEATHLKFFYEGDHDVRDYDAEIHGKKFNPSAAILTMQFCIEPGKAYMVVWDHPEAPTSYREQKRLKKQIQKLLCNPDTKVVGQNAKFDCGYVHHHLGFRYRIGGDTLMLAALLDENQLSKGQNLLVKQHVPEMAGYDDEFNSRYNKERMWEVPLDDMLDYGCGDVDSGLRLYRVMHNLVREDRKLYQNYKHVSLPGINAMTSMESYGLNVDEAALNELEVAVDETVTEQYNALIREVPREIKRLHVEKGLSFTRPDFVRDILFTHKAGLRLRPKVFTKTTKNLDGARRVPSISTKDHLPYFSDDYPFVAELSEHIKTTRLLGTNIRGFKKKYIHNGLVRPTYSLWTAVTGRTASEDPNGQNFPKRGKLAKAYRRVYIPPPGYFVIEADLSQAELRLAADAANEQTMLSIYRSGGDIHKETALIVMGISKAQFERLSDEEQGLARFKAKAVNFGFVYGMGWKKFIGYAKTQYGVEFTEEEAQHIRDGFFRKYPGLAKWHAKIRAEVRQNMQVRSYSGRIRHLPMIESEEEYIQQEAERQAINSPIQEFASSLGVMAMSRLDEEIDPECLRPVAFVHDAIYCYVKKEYLDWGARTLKWYMESNPIEECFGVRMKCPIVADVSFGENFGDTNELKGLRIVEPYDYAKFYTPNEEDKGVFVPAQSFPPKDGMVFRY